MERPLGKINGYGGLAKPFIGSEDGFVGMFWLFVDCP